MSLMFVFLIGVVSALQTCHEFFPLCAECSSDFSQCLVCKSGYYLLQLRHPDDTYQTTCVPSCSAFHSHSLDSTSRACKSNCSHSCNGLCIDSKCQSPPQNCKAWEVWDPENQKCTAYSCPPHFYNEQGTCRPCHNTCASCNGATSNDCLQCVHPLYLSNPFTTGSCEIKTVSNTQYDLFVQNYEYPPPTKIDGTLMHPYSDLRDALIRAAQLAEIYTQPIINIFLTRGIHYIPLEEETSRFGSAEWLHHSRFHFKGTVQPLWCNYTASQIQHICSEQGQMVEIRVKIGAYFSIPLPDSLLISHLIFDFADSLVPWNSGCQTQRAKSCELTLLNDLPVVSSQNPECQCTSPLRSASSCNFNHPLALFYSKPGSIAKQFSLTNSEIRNVFTSYSSIFTTHEDLKLSLLNSNFTNISLCGSVINTEQTPPFGNTIYSKVQRAFMARRTAAHSSTTGGSNKPPLLINKCKFTQIGLALHFNSSPLSIFYQDGSLFSKYASVLNLHNYPVKIIISENTFQDNKIYLNPPSSFSLDQSIPGTGVVIKKASLLKSAMIYISNSVNGISFMHNQVNSNSGLRGVLMIEMPSAYTRGALLYGNKFTHNSGYFDSSVLTLIGSESESHASSCSGFHVLESQFSHNVALSNSMSLITVHCEAVLVMDVNKDGITSVEEYMMAQASFPRYPTPDSNIQSEAVDSSYPLAIDYQYSRFADLLVYENFKPQSGSLFSALMMRQLQIENVRFIRNGDFALASKYSSVQKFCSEMGGLHSEASLLQTEFNSMLGDSTLLLIQSQSLTLRSITIRDSFASKSQTQQFGYMLGFHCLQEYQIDLLHLDGFYFPDSQFMELLSTTHDTSPFPSNQLTPLSTQGATISSTSINSLILLRANLSSINSDSSLIQAENALTLKQSEFGGCSGSSLISVPSLMLNNTLIHDTSFSQAAFDSSQLSLFNSTLLYLQGTLQDLQQGYSILISSSFISHVRAKTPSSPLFQLSSHPVVTLQHSSFSFNSAGSLFSVLQGRLQIYNCSFLSNIGLTGSVALVSGNSELTSHRSKYLNNSANTGGVFYLQDRATLIVDDNVFQENKSWNIAGVLFFIGKSIFSVSNTLFFRNQAYSHGSVIHGVSEDKNLVQQIVQSQFIENKGLSTLYTFQTQLDLTGLEYRGNQDHQSQGSPIYFIGSQIRLQNSLFSNQDYMGTMCSEDAGNKGSFVYDLSDNNLLIQSTKFMYGCAYQGGAMLMSGSSQVTIENCDFEHNKSFEYGGAIYALDFQSWKVKDSRFKSNSAYEEAADIYLQDSFNILEIQNSTFSGEDNTAVQCLWTRMSIKNSIFENIEIDPKFQSIVECKNCAYYVLENNSFRNIKGGRASEAIGFLTYLGNDSHSLRVVNNTYENIEARLDGGALYVSEVAPNNMKIEHNYFQNVGSEGNGGAIAVKQPEEPHNQITVQFNEFLLCTASEGGALYWSQREPLISANNYTQNSALIYGNDIASYGRRIGFVSQQFVLDQRDKTSVELNLFELTEQQSGGVLSSVYLAHFDKYGQVVKSINGDTVFAKVEEASLSNNNKNQWKNGTIKVEGLKLIGQPGALYQISLTSPHINDQAPDVRAYLAERQSPSSDIIMSIHLRKCKPGEAYLSSGECQRCEPGTYLLKDYSAPQECFQCPDQALCFGGDQIGPKPGYWRGDRMSVNFFNCFNEQACLGSSDGPQYDPKGSCHQGYTGVLCGQCENGFTRNSRFECSKCPPFVTNVTLLVTFLLLLIVACVLFIYFTLNSVNKEKSVFSIYVKAFVNHLQLLMLVSSFNLSWPSEVSNFLSTSKSVADAPQQLFSIDCFIQSSNPPIKRFYIYLIMYSLMPLIGLLSICIFWGLRFRSNPQKRSRKIISSSLVYFFLIHPSVTTVIMQSFYCIDIDGTYRLAEQLSQECWSGDHMAFSMSVGLLGLLIWTLGIPTCTMLLLYDQRKNRAQKSIKEKYGFLYKGYTQRSYMWEILVMYRKVFIAFISIFLASYGTMTQALVLLVVIMLFIFLTLRKRPFETDHLNELEVVSLFALIITVYCGLFFLSSRHPQSLGFEYRRDFYLSTSGRWMLFLLILVSNLTFLVLWLWRLFTDLRDTLRSRCRRFYLCCCLLCNRNLLAMELKDSREEQKNYLKIKQIQEICEGRIK